MKQEAICHYTDTPLTLPRGGHAASRQHYQYPQMTRKNLSVPSKRVETLPLAAAGTSLVAGGAFQYPQSGSRPCRWHAVRAIAPRELDFQYPQSGSRPCRIAQFNGAGLPTEAFSTLKAGRDLAAHRRQHHRWRSSSFQYPQSGSRPCRLRWFMTSW